MNYGFWLLVGQSSQISLAAQQARQLGQIHGQLAQQNFIQQQQAVLAQALFEAEQFAGRVNGLAPYDPFAAGVLSRMRLQITSDIQPHMFTTIDGKRAWAGAVECLAQHWKRVESDPTAQRVVAAVDGLMRWRAVVGPDHRQSLAAFEQAVTKAKEGKRGSGRRRFYYSLESPGWSPGSCW